VPPLLAAWTRADNRSGRRPTASETVSEASQQLQQDPIQRQSRCQRKALPCTSGCLGHASLCIPRRGFGQHVYVSQLTVGRLGTGMHPSCGGSTRGVEWREGRYLRVRCCLVGGARSLRASCRDGRSVGLLGPLRSHGSRRRQLRCERQISLPPLVNQRAVLHERRRHVAVRLR